MSIIDDYIRITGDDNTNEPIVSFSPTPTERDYERGFFRRYFIQKTNDKSAPIYEVNTQTFTRYQKKSEFVKVVLKWRLTGSLVARYDGVGNIIDIGVKESNRKSIEIHKNKIPGLKYRLGNLLQFYRQ